MGTAGELKYSADVEVWVGRGQQVMIARYRCSCCGHVFARMFQIISPPKQLMAWCTKAREFVSAQIE